MYWVGYEKFEKFTRGNEETKKRNQRQIGTNGLAGNPSFKLQTRLRSNI